MELSVANVAELANLHVAELPSGSQCLVLTPPGPVPKLTWYTLDKTNVTLSVANGTSVIAPQVGSPIAGGGTSLWIACPCASVG